MRIRTGYSDTTVIIPVKEEPAVEKVTKGVMGALPGCRVIVIHKGALNMRFRNRNLKIIKQVGRGKGTGMLQAAKSVRTPIMCFIDGDNTYEVKDLGKVVNKIRGGADMALGNRFEGMSRDAMPTYVKFGNKILTATANLLYGLSLNDSQTGLRAIRKKVFDRLSLKETEFGIEEEMNIKSAKKKLKVVEIPAKYYVRTGEEKHSKTSGGFKLFFINFKLLFR